MAATQERRRSERSALRSKLLLKRLDQKEEKEITIDILDVSKSGIGFVCNEPLLIGSVYETFLTIWTKEVIHAFVEITRIVKKGEGFEYGATFVGMSAMEQKRIEIYQTFEKHAPK